MARQRKPSQEAAGRRPTKADKKRISWLQRLLLLGFAVLVLVFAELLLRLVGYGPELGLIITRAELNGTRIMGLNPFAWRRFALRPIPVGPGQGRIRSYDFHDPKPSGVFRIFFLGGSSVQGVPYGRNANMAAFLQTLLQEAWPQVRVEVINCGVTAVNSYSLRAWAPEVLGYEPDMLVVYAGHNEFYGFYGPGSLFGVGTNRTAILAHMWIRQLRLGIAVRSLVGLFRPAPQPQPAGTLMEMMAKDRLIRLDSPTYTACRDNFRANLEDIVQAARDAGVPIVLCGLVSNERDLVPMVSAHREGLAPDQRQQWQAYFDQAGKKMAEEDFPGALETLQQAARIDATHAELIYRMAQCLEKTGKIEQARAMYRRARDLDALRFRATGEFSEVIRKVADNRALYVDTLAAFEADSPNGLIGWNLMTDHLHPTARGHYLIARAIVTALAKRGGSFAPHPLRSEAVLSFEQACERLGCDELTELVASLYILKLMDAYPFAGSPNAAHAKDLMNQVARQLRSLPTPVARVIGPWAKAGGRGSIHFEVAKMYLANGDTEQALKYLQRADREAEPHSLESVEIKLALARCLAAGRNAGASQRLQEHLERLLPYAREAARIHPDQKPALAALIRQAEQMLRGRVQ